MTPLRLFSKYHEISYYIGYFYYDLPKLLEKSKTFFARHSISESLSFDEIQKFLEENRSITIFILNHYKKRIKTISESPNIQSRFVGIFREEISEYLIPKVDSLTSLLESEPDYSKFLSDYMELLKSAVGCYLADFELTKIHLSNELIISPPYSERIKTRHDLVRELDRLVQGY